MKNRVSLSLSVAALMIVLMQAETEAHQSKKIRGSRHDLVRPSRANLVRVLKKERRPLSRLRERAQQVEPLIAAAAIKYRVDPFAIWTIAYNETRFRWWLVSPARARGLMQFIDSTAQNYGLKDPFNVPEAIDAAARYVRDMSSQFNGRLDLILASYNAGARAVEAYLKGVRILCRDGKVINPKGIKTGGIPPYTETRKYVSQGLKVYGRIRRAEIFSQAVISQSRLAEVPESETVRSLVAAYSLNDQELAEIGAAPSVLLTAGQAASLKQTSKSSENLLVINQTRQVERAQTESNTALIEEVFYDVHSGVRYLVKDGEIVRPLGPPVQEMNPPQNKPVKNVFVVARSSYYGGHGE